jgi:hypothetical protein
VVADREEHAIAGTTANTAGYSQRMKLPVTMAPW